MTGTGPYYGMDTRTDSNIQSPARCPTDAEPVDTRGRLTALTAPEPRPEPPMPKLIVRDLQGVAFAEVMQLPGLVLLRIGDRDLALSPQSAAKLAAALADVALRESAKAETLEDYRREHARITDVLKRF